VTNIYAKLGKEYLNASLCQYVLYFLQHSETFDVSHVFLPLAVAELSMLKQVRFFGPPCINYCERPDVGLCRIADSSAKLCVGAVNRKKRL